VNGFRGSRRRSPDREVSSHDGPSRRNSDDIPNKFSKPPSSPGEENWEEEEDTSKETRDNDFSKPPSSPTPDKESWDDVPSSEMVTKEIPVHEIG